MYPEEKLDTLLSYRGHDGRQQAEQALANGIAPGDGHTDLQPLLDAADRLAELGGMEPSSDFAGRLETRYFARIAEADVQIGAESSMATYGMTPWLASAPSPTDDEMPLPLGNDAPTLPGLQWAVRTEGATEADGAPSRRAGGGLWRGRARRARSSRLLGPVLAAALLLVIGGMTFTAVAAAGPGTPLYALHRWEQNVQVSMAGSAGDRTRLHLAYARDALAALDAAIARHQGSATYDDALATFRDEMSAASAMLESVPAGGEHDALAAQLGQVRAQGRGDLRTALAALPWSERIATTSALANIGDSVLQVTQASVVRLGHGQHLWQITVTGTGFEQGAMLLVDGQPTGEVTSVTASTLVALLARDDSAPLPNSIGVANPDKTAAVTRTISSHEQEGGSTPTPHQTPPGDDHGGKGSGSGSPGGSGSGG